MATKKNVPTEAAQEPQMTATEPAAAKNAEPDILERMDAATDLEAEMADTPQEPVGPKADPKPKTRKAVRSTQAATSRAREERIAADQNDLTNEASLRAAISTSTIMKGTVASVEDISDKKSDEILEIAVVVLLDKRTKVIIPFPQVFTYNPIDMSTVNTATVDGRRSYIKRKRQFAEKLIGAQLQFCLTHVERQGDTFFAVGSRAQAMNILNRACFGSNRCKEGDIGDATITAVSRHAVAVEFNGVDVVIPQYKLSLRWMRYVSDFYHIGDKLRVRVRSVKMQDGMASEVTLDHIACELMDAKDRYAMLKDGSRVKGIVTNVYRPVGTRSIFIYAWLPEWEIPAKILRINANDFGREIKAGTVMRLQVAGHDENGYVMCYGLSEHGHASALMHAR